MRTMPPHRWTRMTRANQFLARYSSRLAREQDFRQRAKETYALFEAGDGGSFRWMRLVLFHDTQRLKDLTSDCKELLEVLAKFAR